MKYKLFSIAAALMLSAPLNANISHISCVEGISVAREIEQPLTQMIDGARNAGINIYLAAGYRDIDEQRYVYMREIYFGLSAAEASARVGSPGHSDYETGFAVDITDCYYEHKSTDYSTTETYNWLSQHCKDYGFSIPDAENRPWHLVYDCKNASDAVAERPDA